MTMSVYGSDPEPEIVEGETPFELSGPYREPVWNPYKAKTRGGWTLYARRVLLILCLLAIPLSIWWVLR